MNTLQKKLSFVVISLGVFVAGCSSQDPAATKEKATVVELQPLQEEIFPTYLSYLGTVMVKELKNYSFTMSGKVESIAVNKGDFVEAGQELARLETTEMQLAVHAAQGQYKAAQAAYEKAVNGAQMEDREQAKLTVEQAKIAVKQAENVVAKAKEGYEFIETQYKKQEQLYTAGAISRYDLDKLKLDLDMTKIDYDNAKQQLSQAEVGLSNAKQTLNKVENGTRVEDIESMKGQAEQAKANLDAKLEIVSDAVVYADRSGYISELPVKAGDVINAGTPVVIMRDASKIVQTGVTANDFSKIKIGTNVIVTANDQTYYGKVTYLKDIPDMQTRTYTSEITLNEEMKLPLGQVVNVDFQLGEKNAIAVPITSILNDGEKDYVYVAESNRAVRKLIKIMEINETNAIVSGLLNGDVLVTKGIKSLRGGTLITTIETSDQPEQAILESVSEQGVNQNE
ncbi:efflux RND transporter periplasmic adaptor subunit [Bacillus sp. Marseille-P3661]|uniref:efflux RND transporter periplasmic adaptor subunit n=1 Tax=Bacillus sp. Marseille-P3661 TaxID=1936234 RepID=UPI000C81A8D1|nr:efflux RND transporter periplasmic adaptor subunit [Bacillus sp. Marseille-P3661]